MSQLIAFVFAILAFVPGGQSLSYRNLTGKEETQAFFRDAAHGYEGKLVHVHSIAKRIHGAPGRVARSKKGAVVHVFENQSVPLVIDPASVYYRKILDRTLPSERICLKGEVRREPAGGKDRLALWVHTIKRAHDAPQQGKSKGSTKAKATTTKR